MSGTARQTPAAYRDGRGLSGGLLTRRADESNLILPRVDLPLRCRSVAQNIRFHYVWTVAYPLPIDRRGHESKALLADHGYPSHFNPSR